jgi:hypothetical protein
MISDNVCVLMRKTLEEEGEFEVAAQHLQTLNFRSDVPRDSLVVGRYSVLPFYRELEEELACKNARLINSYEQHSFIADVSAWANGPLVGLTPRTWDSWVSLPTDKSFVLKGKTNSRKGRWNTHMFAPTRDDVPTVARRLLDDQMISEQGLVVREYVPLKQLDMGLNGLPISNEWRTFWLADDHGLTCLSAGFYWQSHPDARDKASLGVKGQEIMWEAARRIRAHANFFVLDIAETASGGWIVVEVNDGQMSGLSCCDPRKLYHNLKLSLSGW